jgi:hypothetical protein
LGVVTAEALEQQELVLILDAFGHQLKIEPPAQADERSHHGNGLGALESGSDE